jgi:tetratricopeptide (TPR) repeat protein
MHPIMSGKAEARALLVAGDRRGALAAYEALRVTRPDDVGVLDALGFLYFMAGRPADAEECCRRSIQLSPDNFYAHKGLGLCLARLGQPDEGIAALERSIAINPRYFDSHFDLGVVLGTRRWDNGRMPERALAVDPTRQVHRLLAQRLRAAHSEPLLKATRAPRPASPRRPLGACETSSPSSTVACAAPRRL